MGETAGPPRAYRRTVQLVARRVQAGADGGGREERAEDDHRQSGRVVEGGQRFQPPGRPGAGRRRGDEGGQRAGHGAGA
ncbi:hypothetical protein [Streptomyces sp. NBC_00572]|uniref:hypothetical protein n=1 Tax=Streptomyces sp. NBC_00572 TaxID=2903664 RepID=UPI002B1DE5A6|nr:hypothetical protein [Streptomyces sp. NBC_00572]